MTAEALDELKEWYAGYRQTPGSEPDTYVICAGLAVLERARESFPLEEKDYKTPKNQVRTSGRLIQSILARFGEERRFTSEGGRTTRGTVPAADALVQRLNALESLSKLSTEERGESIHELQAWMTDRVRDYFARQRLEVEVNPIKPSFQTVSDILDAAPVGKRGAIAQHLVGAKLAIRFPNLTVDNFSHTAADQQLGRPGDFQIGDTAFHVTMAPTSEVVERCRENLRNGYRPCLLVPERRIQAARQLAENVDASADISIVAIESFVGQNIEEMGQFSQNEIAVNFRQLLQTYNERVAAAEPDPSLLVKLPDNL